MQLRFIFSELGKGLSRNRFMTVAVVIVTFVSLLFVGVAGLSQMQVDRMKTQWYGKIEVSLFMCALNDKTKSCGDQEATSDQIDAVRAKLNSPEVKPIIKEVYEETQEETYQNFLKLFGDKSIAQWTTPDMLGKTFRVRLVDPNQYPVIKEQFSSMPGLSEVKDQRDLVEPLFALFDKAKVLSLGLAAIMIIAAVLLIATTIRLSAMSREKETSIMRYVGASSLFIQAPFMIEGALSALLGAVLAVLTLGVGVQFLVTDWLAQALPWTSFIGMQEVFIMAPILIIAALFLALMSSGLSLAKYTKI